MFYDLRRGRNQRIVSAGLHSFICSYSGTRPTRISRYQKGKTNLDFTEARDSEWQWHQLGHMHVCTLLQTDNHASTSPLSFFTGRMPFLPPNQQRQSTEGNKLDNKKTYARLRPLLKASIQRAPDVEVELNRSQIVVFTKSVSDAQRVLFHRVGVGRPTFTIVRPKLQ